MEKFWLGVILVAAVGGLVVMLRRSVRHADDPSKPPSCAGCPFSSKCEMQDAPRRSAGEPEPAPEE